MGGHVTQKSLYFLVLKNLSITWTFWSAVSPRATGIKIVYLASSKNGDYADIDIIPQKLVFLKNSMFSFQFVSALDVHLLKFLKFLLIPEIWI